MNVLQTISDKWFDCFSFCGVFFYVFTYIFMTLYTTDEWISLCVCMRVYINAQIDAKIHLMIIILLQTNLCIDCRWCVWQYVWLSFTFIQRRLFTLGELIKIIYRIEPNSNIQLFTQIIFKKLDVEIYIFSFYKRKSNFYVAVLWI